MSEIRVLAESPGTVFRIEAPPGTEVGEDQTILLLESMKMEIPVPAPRAGRVKEILVNVGEVVDEGDEIAVLEG